MLPRIITAVFNALAILGWILGAMIIMSALGIHDFSGLFIDLIWRI